MEKYWGLERHGVTGPTTCLQGVHWLSWGVSMDQNILRRSSSAFSCTWTVCISKLASFAVSHITSRFMHMIHQASRRHFVCNLNDILFFYRSSIFWNQRSWWPFCPRLECNPSVWPSNLGKFCLLPVWVASTMYRSVGCEIVFLSSITESYLS